MPRYPGTVPETFLDEGTRHLMTAKELHVTVEWDVNNGVPTQHIAAKETLIIWKSQFTVQGTVVMYEIHFTDAPEITDDATDVRLAILGKDSRRGHAVRCDAL